MQAAKQVEPNGNQSLESGTCHLFSISHHSAEEIGTSALVWRSLARLAFWLDDVLWAIPQAFKTFSTCVVHR
ncbi:hypothetical protein M513_05684, partial [Trichuris suis]